CTVIARIGHLLYHHKWHAGRHVMWVHGGLACVNGWVGRGVQEQGSGSRSAGHAEKACRRATVSPCQQSCTPTAAGACWGGAGPPPPHGLPCPSHMPPPPAHLPCPRHCSPALHPPPMHLPFPSRLLCGSLLLAAPLAPMPARLPAALDAAALAHSPSAAAPPPALPLNAHTHGPPLHHSAPPSPSPPRLLSPHPPHSLPPHPALTHASSFLVPSPLQHCLSSLRHPPLACAPHPCPHPSRPHRCALASSHCHAPCSSHPPPAAAHHRAAPSTCYRRLCHWPCCTGCVVP
ncbi:unnamed protein product, partial [Closterium sp. NIES-54]